MQYQEVVQGTTQSCLELKTYYLEAESHIKELRPLSLRPTMTCYRTNAGVSFLEECAGGRIKNELNEKASITIQIKKIYNLI